MYYVYIHCARIDWSLTENVSIGYNNFVSIIYHCIFYWVLKFMHRYMFIILSNIPNLYYFVLTTTHNVLAILLFILFQEKCFLNVVLMCFINGENWILFSNIPILNKILICWGNKNSLRIIKIKRVYLAKLNINITVWITFYALNKSLKQIW